MAEIERDRLRITYTGEIMNLQRQQSEMDIQLNGRLSTGLDCNLRGGIGISTINTTLLAPTLLHGSITPNPIPFPQFVAQPPSYDGESSNSSQMLMMLHNPSPMVEPDAFGESAGKSTLGKGSAASN